MSQHWFAFERPSPSARERIQLPGQKTSYARKCVHCRGVKKLQHDNVDMIWRAMGGQVGLGHDPKSW